MPFDTLVDTAAVAGHLDDPAWLLFDCRFNLADPGAGRRAFDEGHLPGAVHVDLDRDLAGPKGAHTGRHPLPDPDELAARLREWGVTPAHQLVAYDDGPGGIAARFWWLMRHLGLTRVAVLDGGLRQWLEEGRPLSREAAQRESADWRPGTRCDDTVPASEFERPAAEREYLLLDARAAERFRGENEPIDPVAGHVPGAVNRPFLDNLGDDGRFRDPVSLRREFQRLTGDRPPERVAHMCGSGVTACHNLLAMEHAGLHGSRLYVGSWSHWITDSERPVATGRK